MDTNKKVYSATPYTQIIEQIEELQQEAKRLRDLEIRSVIDTIQKQISYYNITLQELGYSGAYDEGRCSRRSHKGIYYKNKDGQTWSGVGRQPKWLKEELANGMKKEDFLVNESDDNISVALNPLQDRH